MSESLGTTTIDAPEKRISGKLIVRTLGKAALMQAGVWAGKNLARRSEPVAYDLLDRFDLLEREGHPQSVKIFKSLAKSFGVEVTEEHLAYWRNMLTVTGVLDALIDEGPQPTSLSQEVDTLLSGQSVPGISEADAEQFRTFITDALTMRHDTIMEGLDVEDIVGQLRATSDPDEILRLRRKEGGIFSRKVDDIVDNMRATSDPSELIRLRKEEAAIYGRIMTLDNPAQDPSIEAFNDYFFQLCEAGYLLDSLVDLFKDYKNGVTAVKPTPSHYIAIGKEALRTNYQSLSQLPRQTVARLAVASVKKAVRKSLKVHARQSK